MRPAGLAPTGQCEYCMGVLRELQGGRTGPGARARAFRAFWGFPPARPCAGCDRSPPGVEEREISTREATSSTTCEVRPPIHVGPQTPRLCTLVNCNMLKKGSLQKAQLACAPTSGGTSSANTGRLTCIAHTCVSACASVSVCGVCANLMISSNFTLPRPRLRKFQLKWSGESILESNHEKNERRMKGRHYLRL